MTYKKEQLVIILSPSWWSLVAEKVSNKEMGEKKEEEALQTLSGTTIATRTKHKRRQC